MIHASIHYVHTTYNTGRGILDPSARCSPANRWHAPAPVTRCRMQSKSCPGIGTARRLYGGPLCTLQAQRVPHSARKTCSTDEEERSRSPFQTLSLRPLHRPKARVLLGVHERRGWTPCTHWRLIGWIPRHRLGKRLRVDEPIRTVGDAARQADEDVEAQDKDQHPYASKQPLLRRECA
eukprot:scaffold9484_cov124-Isochrysis_galbana.AAC.2